MARWEFYNKGIVWYKKKFPKGGAAVNLLIEQRAFELEFAPFEKVTEDELRHTALHEVLHALLADLPDTTKHHEIINTLIGVFYEYKSIQQKTRK